MENKKNWSNNTRTPYVMTEWANLLHVILELEQAEDGMNITGFAAQAAMESMVGSTEEASNTAHGIVNQILGVFEPWG